ncbi:MAG: acyl-CoA acyltransferase [Alphaproteobacteria bacterium]|nr:acyl-CoA acyltransferase [Alphaproteobacteria bacterium]
MVRNALPTIQQESSLGVGTQRSVVCREIRLADKERVAQLLARGFVGRKRVFWDNALATLARHQAPPGYPQFGYLLECDGKLVGCLLLVFTAVGQPGTEPIRCSVSSWYTEPAFRGYSALMAARALRFKSVTYFNITPHPKTYSALEAQGYRRYCDGRFICIPTLRHEHNDASVMVVESDGALADGFPEWEMRLLREHAGYGCLSLICTLDGRNYPFVFLQTRMLPGIRSAYLAYCRDIADFRRFAGPLGRFLLRRGTFTVELDSSAAIAGLAGVYVGGAPKYFKGSAKPRIGDLSYSERAMFNF